MNPLYEIKPTSSGTFELYFGGQRKTTGTSNYVTDLANRQVYGNQLPVQQTTTAMRTQAVENNAKLDKSLANISAANSTKGQPGTVTVTRDIDNGDGTRTVTYSDGKTAKVTATKNADGTESYKEVSAEQGIQNQADKDISSAQEGAKDEIDYVNTTLDSISSQVSSSTQALISSIKSTYGTRIKLMEQSNRRLLKGKNQAGQRTGRSRYANEIEGGILTDEENQGIERVAKLEGDMLSLIAQAEQARTNKELDIFNDRMNQLDKINDNLQTEVQNLQKVAFDKLTEMRAAEKAEREANKAELDMQLDKSERAAPALAKALSALTTPEDRTALLEEYSKRTGIPIEYLISDVEKATSAEEKANLDTENIRSQIETREKSADTSARRLELDKKKEDFNPTEEQKATVGKYLSTKGTDEDSKKAKEDPDFFYYILSLAEEEEI